MDNLTRRAFAGGVLAAIALGRYKLFAQSAATYPARAIRLVEESPVVDLLNQFRFPDYAEKPPKIDKWLNQPDTFTRADAEEYLGSGINVFSLGAGTSDYEAGLRFFARWNGFLAAHPEWLLRVTSVADIERAHRDKRVGVMITLQDSTHSHAARRG